MLVYGFAKPMEAMLIWMFPAFANSSPHEQRVAPVVTTS